MYFTLYLTYVVYFLTLYTCFLFIWLVIIFHMVPWCVLFSVKDNLKPSQDSELSSCSNFQGSNLLDFAYFVILSRMYSRTFNVLLWFCHRLPKGEIVRFTFVCNWHILYNKTQFTCLLFVIVFYMVHITYLLSAFRKNRYGINQNNQS